MAALIIVGIFPNLPSGGHDRLSLGTERPKQMIPRCPGSSTRRQFINVSDCCQKRKKLRPVTSAMVTEP